MLKRGFAVFFVLFMLSIIISADAQMKTSGKQENYKYLGRLSANKYDPESVSNPLGMYGNPYGNTVNNPLSIYGSQYSPVSINYTLPSGSSPILIGEDGKYLGKLNSNIYDPESVSNPYGRYGSPYSPDSINNPYGKYGSPYSPYSVTNPYTSMAPKIYAPASSNTNSFPTFKSTLLKWFDEK